MLMLVAALLALTHGYLADAQIITKEEFDSAIQSNGYPAADPQIYPYFAEATKNFSREELAMFLAQVFQESDGFQCKEEQACLSEKSCADKYQDEVGLPGKSYHGRGYIQLTGGANYKAASEDLGMADYLLQNPEVVTSDTRIAVAVSVWYWETKVRPALVGNENKFGATTKAINGAVECSGEPNEKAQTRYIIYMNVAELMNVQNKAVESGCYN